MCEAIGLPILTMHHLKVKQKHLQKNYLGAIEYKVVGKDENIRIPHLFNQNMELLGWFKLKDQVFYNLVLYKFVGTPTISQNFNWVLPNVTHHV